MPTIDTYIFDRQPEFPEIDLTEPNAERLSVALQNEQRVDIYHKASKNMLVFRALHPLLVGGVARVHEGSRVDAISHGIMVFEAITSAVTSVSPERVSTGALSLIVQSEKTVRRITDPTTTKDVCEAFEDKLPRTAGVVSEASKRFFPNHVEYAVAGAALECLITSQALRIQ